MENCGVDFGFMTKKFNFKYRSNNWLKLHGYNMRRKPFARKKIIRDRIILDECQLRFNNRVIFGTAGEGMGFRFKLEALNNQSFFY